MDQLFEVSGISATTPGRKDDTPSEYALPQLMGPMQMIPVAPHEHESEREVPADATIEKIVHNAPDVNYTGRLSEGWSRREGEDQGMVPLGPSVATTEYMHDNDQVSEGAHHTIQTGTPRGECRCPDVISFSLYQSQNETPRI